MRKNLVTALLVACCALLVANLVVSLNQTPLTPVAIGQASGNFILAASNTQNEAYCFVYDISNKRLAAYSSKGSKGLEFRGVRWVNYDFKPREFPRSSSQTAVRNMEKLLKSLDKKK